MKRNVYFSAAAAALLLMFMVLTGAIVRIQGHNAEKESEARYIQLEREYVGRMREMLDAAGFRNSGVMLTRTVYEDNTKEYCVAIHHSRFDSLSAEEKEALVEELRSMGFEEKNCSFVYSLTGNA